MTQVHGSLTLDDLACGICIRDLPFCVYGFYHARDSYVLETYRLCGCVVRGMRLRRRRYVIMDPIVCAR